MEKKNQEAIKSQEELFSMKTNLHEIVEKFNCPTCMESFVDFEGDSGNVRLGKDGLPVQVFTFQCCGYVICSSCARDYCERNPCRQKRSEDNNTLLSNKCMRGCEDSSSHTESVVTLKRCMNDAFGS